MHFLLASTGIMRWEVAPGVFDAFSNSKLKLVLVDLLARKFLWMGTQRLDSIIADILVVPDHCLTDSWLFNFSVIDLGPITFILIHFLH